MGQTFVLFYVKIPSFMEIYVVKEFYFVNKVRNYMINKLHTNCKYPVQQRTDHQ